MARISLVLVFAWCSTPVWSQSTQPAVATRPAATQPTSQTARKFPQRELNEEERKQLQTALHDAHVIRMAGAARLEWDIRDAMHKADRARNEKRAKAMRTAENKNNNQSLGGTNRTEDIEYNKLAQYLSNLRFIESAHIATQETLAFIKFDQLDSAYTEYRNVAAILRGLKPLPEDVYFRYRLENLTRIAEKEYAEIKRPAEFNPK